MLTQYYIFDKTNDIYSFITRSDFSIQANIIFTE